MQQAYDFLEECEALAQCLSSLDAKDWERATQFKGWTLNDVVVHLFFWNRAADLAYTDPEAFAVEMEDVFARMATGGLRPIENERTSERGGALFEAWTAQFRDMAERWSGIDPKTRVKWVGPDMSVRSSMTARQMETWAHGQEVFDLLGQTRENTDRIRNIVVLGVNTFGWSHKVQGLPTPEHVPRLRLTAPSGAVWSFGDDAAEDLIEGPAVAFAQVVTQTRNLADTELSVHGPQALQWMQTAQCFAGQKETPPAPGTRHTSQP